MLELLAGVTPLEAWLHSVVLLELFTATLAPFKPSLTGLLSLCITTELGHNLSILVWLLTLDIEPLVDPSASLLNKTLVVLLFVHDTTTLLLTDTSPKVTVTPQDVAPLTLQFDWLLQAGPVEWLLLSAVLGG